MEYAQLNEDGSYGHQITTHGNVEWDDTHLCPVSALTQEEAEYFRVVPLIETDPPPFDPITHVCVRDGGMLVDGLWFYRWTVTALDDETVAANIEAARLASIPASITMRQARLALLGAGMLAGVGAAIDSLPEPLKSAAQIEWEYSNEVQRHNGFVEQLAPALGLTTAQLDALFIAAAKL